MIFNNPKLNLSLAKSITQKSNSLTLEDNSIISGLDFFPNNEDVVDINKLLNKDFQLREPVIAVASLYCQEDCVKTFGMHGEWFFSCIVNNKIVYDRLEKGSSLWSPEADAFKVNLKAGENIIVLYIEAGAAGFMSFTFVDFDEVLTVPPMLSYPSSTAITISAFLIRKYPLILEYRKAGSNDDFTVVRNSNAGCYSALDFHKFQLDNLCSNTTYEYYLTVPWIHGNVVKGPFYFKTYANEMTNHKVVILGDTQMRKPVLEQVLGNLAQNKHFDNANLLVHVGDTRSLYQNFVESYTEYLDVILPLTKSELPLHQVRGNHEYYGIDTDAFSTYLGKSYSGFSIGDVYYLTLNSGWDVDASKLFVTQDAQDELVLEQQKFIQEVIASKEWKNAKYHVVFCHGACGYDFSSRMQKNMELLTHGLFVGENPTERIDLWICGHTHWAARLDIKTQKYLVARQYPSYFKFIPEEGYVKRVPELQKDYICPISAHVPFPVLVVDGGALTSVVTLNATSSGLEVLHHDVNNELIDHFTIDQNYKLNIIETKMDTLDVIQKSLFEEQ
jgi:hypothetical protein